jgi:hypothetical protein
VLELAEAHHVAIVGHVLVHVAERDVPDHVIHVEERSLRGARARGAVTRQEGALVVRAVDEGMDRVAVGGDGRAPDRAVLVRDRRGLLDAPRAAFRGLLVRPIDVLDLERDVLHAVAVAVDVLRDRPLGTERRREDEPDLSLLEQVRRAVADLGFETGVPRDGEPERVHVVERGLAGIPDPELDVVDGADL